MKKILLPIIAIIGVAFSCKKAPEDVPVASVSITQATAEMLIGETIQLAASVQPSNATEKTISWASSKISVATVSNGKVTAIAEGVSTITASCGGKSATCQVTVSKAYVAVTSVTLNKTELTLEKGKTETLTATVSPSDATDQTVTWSSSKTDIAIVDANGKVTAVAGGSAIITAKAGDKQATCTVIVTVPVESITLDRESVTLEEGETTMLTAMVKPDDATDKTVTWSSSNSEIATVDETGKVTAIKEGEASITAKAGEKTASCKVTINKKVIAVESVSLDKTTLSLFEGESAKLAATVKPDNASDKTVTWGSGSPEIASVDQEGNVKAIKAGSATITAKAGEKQANCQVTVQEKPKVTSITFKTDSFNGYIGKDYPIEVTVFPDNAQYDLEWTATDSRVASIQGSGLSATIHTLDYGKSDIQVKDKISGKSASITVSTVVTDFVWSESTSEKYSGYPLITIEVGGEHQLKYSCTPNSATKIFADLSEFVFYEPSAVVSSPTCITISEDGVVRGVKEGTVGIKPTGRIIKGSSASDRIYFKVKPATIQVTGIALNKSSISLNEGDSETLSATISPSNATNKTVSWTSSNASVATVTNGKVSAISSGTAIITARVGELEANCSVTVLPASGPFAVNLGLSVKWASYNVGANAPEEYGDYFAWGEASPKNEYTWTTYKWANGSWESITKYNTKTSYGVVDKKYVLEMEDDAARFNWGGTWRIPTDAEWTELRTKCTWTWINQGNMNGFMVTAKNGNRIFLPAAGFRYKQVRDKAGYDGGCWSSSLDTDNPSDAWYVRFFSGELYREKYARYLGMPIRPVTE